MNGVALISQEQIESLIRDVQFIKEHLQNSKPGGLYEDLITETQLIEKLGGVHKSTIWRLEKKGKLCPIKIGQNKMYRLSEVLSMNSKQKKGGIKKTKGSFIFR